jgi:hypothetical protein
VMTARWAVRSCRHTEALLDWLPFSRDATSLAAADVESDLS